MWMLICDRCGKDTRRCEKKFRILMKDEREPIDLCKDCQAELGKWIQEGIRKAREESNDDK